MCFFQDFKVGWLVVINVLTFPITISNIVESNPCGSSYLYYKQEGVCISYNTENQTWYEAKDGCSEQGGNLLILPDDILERNEKSTNISQYFGNSSWAWIGIKSDKDNDGDVLWKYATRSVVNPNWKSGEPDDLAENKCVMLYLGKWKDEDCESNQFGRLCEFSPCQVDNGECEHTCVPSPFQCKCDLGYDLVNGTQCKNMGCPVGVKNCQHFCKYEMGSMFCGCYPGYELNYNDEHCDLLNMCRDLNGGCDQECRDVNGTRRICSCGTGYWLTVDGRTCQKTIILAFFVYVLPTIAVLSLISFVLYKVRERWYVVEQRRATQAAYRESRSIRSSRVSQRQSIRKSVMGVITEQAELRRKSLNQDLAPPRIGISTDVDLAMLHNTKHTQSNSTSGDSNDKPLKGQID